MATPRVVPQYNKNLTAFAEAAQGDVDAMARFIVDNNEKGVFTVLQNNGFNYGTHAGAAVILGNILRSKNPQDLSVQAQIGKLQYNNDANNGTGGVIAPLGATTTQGAGDDLLCLAGGIFGIPLGCPQNTPAPDPNAAAAAAAAQANAAAAAARSQTTTYVVIAVVVVVIVLAGLYFFGRKKEEPKPQVIEVHT